MKRSFLLSAILLLGFVHIYAATPYISFNNVYSVTSKVTAKVTTGTILTGSSFKILSSNSFVNAGSAAQALYYVTLEYTNSLGVTLSYPGIIRTDVNSGTASQALLFEQTTSLGVQTLSSPEVYFLLVVPTYEASIGSAVQYTLNASYKASYLPPITTIQDNNAAPVITSNGGGSSATINTSGGVSTVTTVTATDQTTQTPSATYLLKKKGALTITGGANASSFSLTSTTIANQTSASGILSFISAPVWSSSGSNAYNVQVTASDSLGTTDIQNLTVNILQPVVSSTGSLNSFSYINNSGPSGSQSFTVNGTNLYSNVTVTAPTDFEISTTAGGIYGQSLPLTYSNSALSATTIYIRLKSGKTVGTYSGDILVAATDAVTKTISISGSVYNIVTATENVDNKDISVYTDASNNIRISNNTEKKIKISLYTISGKLISENMFSQSAFILKKKLQAGIYFVSVNTDNEVINKKIIIR